MLNDILVKTRNSMYRNAMYSNNTMYFKPPVDSEAMSAYQKLVAMYHLEPMQFSNDIMRTIERIESDIVLTEAREIFGGLLGGGKANKKKKDAKKPYTGPSVLTRLALKDHNKAAEEAKSKPPAPSTVDTEIDRAVTRAMSTITTR